jgi:hypothetical protein
MGEETFQIVFDLTRAGYRTWWFPAHGLVFVVIGAIMVFFPKLLDFLYWGFIKGTGRRAFSWIFFLFACSWITFSFLSTYGEYATLQDRLDRGAVEVVQGRVENFHADAKRESFNVGTARFEYSYFVATSAFNTPSTHGGPLRAGLVVRITHVDGKIVRLEILRTSPAST